MSELIDRQAVMEAIERDAYRHTYLDQILDIIKSMPSVQPDRELIEQLRWERDTAIQQLKDLGYGLGEKPKTDDTISRQAAIDVLIMLGDWYKDDASRRVVHQCICALYDDVPSVQPEWNNHTVACLLAEIFDDTCACNYNDIDEWLPEKCELLGSCPHPVGVACWEQFLKHKAERRTNG